MDNHRHRVKRVVFNITNVCNYTCTNCYSFNNHDFKGHRQWAPFKEIYSKWAKIIDIGIWKITGGEIMTNPDWINWVNGVHNLWPDSTGEICTNGSLLIENKSPVSELYNIMHQSNGKLNLIISLHDIKLFPKIINFSKEFLGETWKIQKINGLNPLLNKILFNQPELFKYDYNFSILLENNQSIKIWIYSGHVFYSPAITFQNNKYDLCNSDPNIANSECQKEYGSVSGVKQGGNSELAFFDGQLYKCNTVKLLQEFDQQFNLNINGGDKNMLYKYKPASINMSLNELKLWFQHVNDAMPICKFCPESYNYNQLVKTNSKKVFIKQNSKLKDDNV